MGTGVTFDDQIHTDRDWGLKLMSVFIPLPDPKKQVVNIPGGDGSIDLTEVNGRPAFNDRDGIKLVFDLPYVNYSEFFDRISQIAKVIHGRKVKMTLDDDPSYYYMVRLNVSAEKDLTGGEVTFSGTADPFRYDIYGTNDPWLWDTFDFETGVIREIEEVEITAENNTVTIIGAGIDTSPVFVVSQADNLQLTYGGRTYTLKVGRNRFPAVRVGKEDVTLTFTGSGKFEVEYRGRYL